MNTVNLLRASPDQMIDLRHRLAVPATCMPLAAIDAALARAFASKDSAGRDVEDANPFGVTHRMQRGWLKGGQGDAHCMRCCVRPG